MMGTFVGSVAVSRFGVEVTTPPPDYEVQFASPTYGEIMQGDSISIPFGSTKTAKS